MKKPRLLLALFVASIGAVQSASARVAPELPAAQALVSGTSYYLYNVIEGKFACHSTTSTSYAALGTYGDKVIITATGNEGEYTIQWANNNYYWKGYDTYVNSNSGTSNYNYFTIAESSRGYTIQRSSRNTSYYKADEFVGFDGSNGDRLSPALAEGSIHWQLFSVDEAEYYMAKHKLYTYLEVADQYNFYVTQYDLVYDNPASTTAELDLAQSTLKEALDMSQNYVSPSWTEYPILFQNNTDNKWTLYNSNKALQWSIHKDYNSALETTSTLMGTVNVDTDATLCYTYDGDSYATMRVYLDGELVQIIYPNQSSDARRYYIEVTAGKHDITWTCLVNDARTNNTSYSHYYYLKEIGIMNTPTITPATTTVEGQLGTEVLKLVDPVSSVKKIIISGVIGADDWTTIGLMVNAFSIDMSGATATADMPASMFTKTKFPFLHNVKLPQGLTAIGNNAFNGSDVENEMTFPESLLTIGNNAFDGSKIRAAYMQEGLTSVGTSAFYNCKFLENASFPASAVTIPGSCFSHCCNLRTFTIPEGITTIEGSAFSGCSQFNPRFPTTLEQIESSAFYNTATDQLVISENMTVNQGAFSYCSNLEYAEWPTSFSKATNYSFDNSTNAIVTNCPKLKDVYLKSPTVVTYDYQRFFDGNTLSEITLHVPDFLVSAYKLDPYWYQCNVVGFNSADISDWNITQPLVLNPGQRIGGTPNLHFSGSNARLTVNGDDTQTINDLSIVYCPKSYYYNGYSYQKEQQWGMMLSNSNHVSIAGELSENIKTNSNNWYFLTLPFDTKVGDIVATAEETGVSTSYAIRYYDGSTRASNGTGNNWKNYSKDDIIPAGTGFIYQTAKPATSKFVAQNNATKQYILSNNEFVKSLEANASDVTANKGWNLVGNPWQTYYNIHKLNFTAPITVWNLSSKKYEAYSIIDDDYAIKPLEAIFVQCPDEINSISFPIDGRQLTDVIESQNAARVATPSERKLIDVELSNDEMKDKTRFVMNPQASMDYELNCDASKFMSMDAAVPQIWTVENGMQLAINERPLDNGTVQIGFKVAKGGDYTISAPRCQFQNIVLVDNETGIETDLSNGGSHTFTANAGTNDSRFVLRVGGTVVTSVNTIDNSQLTIDHYYNLNGQRIVAPQKGLYIVNGKKVIK
ncbi:MAG: leucine-rich repeat domain-containing protein [Prevotella sp.]|nr:leucine-rich repeat domain-containing protein [Prevotella sp.]